MKKKSEKIFVISVFLLCVLFLTENSYPIQSTDGLTGYGLLPSTVSLQKGEVSFSTWGSYVTSDDFKGTGLFPLWFCTGISDTSEISAGFNGINSGIGTGIKLRVYEGKKIYPSTGLLVELNNLVENPDAGISALFQKSLIWHFDLILSGGYTFGKNAARGFKARAGFLYGKDFPRISFGAKTEMNGEKNTIFLSGIFKLLERIYLSLLVGHSFEKKDSTLATAGITWTTFKERKVKEEASENAIVPSSEEKEKKFPSPVPKFRLKMQME